MLKAWNYCSTINLGFIDRQKASFQKSRTQIIFGGKLRRRFFDNQAVELFLQCAALNRMIQLRKPDTYKIEN
jgi:hypothetical protein